MPFTDRGRILVVDDDRDMREAMRDALEDEGYAVALASDGAEALSWLDQAPQPPALILLDWNMTPMNGEAFMAALKRRPVSTPVVVVTVDARVKRREGVALILKKPLDLEDLFAVITRLVKA